VQTVRSKFVDKIPNFGGFTGCIVVIIIIIIIIIILVVVVVTCYSATYMSQTRDQQRFTISVAVSGS